MRVASGARAIGPPGKVQTGPAGSQRKTLLSVGSRPVQAHIEREFPDFDPYPWGRAEWVQTLLLNILCAQPLVEEYAALFTGLGDDELVALADSFRFENCVVREPLAKLLSVS